MARLARIELDPGQVDAYASQLSQILDYVDAIEQADTSSVSQTAQVAGLSNVTRPDEVRDCPAGVVEEMLDGTPDRVGRLVRTKPILPRS